jgi:hypothetical protein
MVLYGCEIWSLTLKEEYRLRVFENRVWDEVMGEWRKLHNDELHMPSIIRMIESRMTRWAGHIARIGEKRNTCILVVGSQKKGDH